MSSSVANPRKIGIIIVISVLAIVLIFIVAMLLFHVNTANKSAVVEDEIIDQ